MTPEETSLISKILDTLHVSLKEQGSELAKNTTSTLLIQKSVETLEHDLLGNGQPGKISKIEDTLSLHSRFIYLAVGGTTVLGIVIGWLVTLLRHK